LDHRVSRFDGNPEVVFPDLWARLKDRERKGAANFYARHLHDKIYGLPAPDERVQLEMEPTPEKATKTAKSAIEQGVHRAYLSRALWPMILLACMGGLLTNYPSTGAVVGIAMCVLGEVAFVAGYMRRMRLVRGWFPTS